MANWNSVEITKSDPVPFSARGVTVPEVIVAYTITAVYSCDDGRTLEITDTYNSMSAFKEQARNRLKSLNAIEGDAIIAGVVDLSPPAPTPPTDDQIALQSYAQKRSILAQTVSDLALGLVDQSAVDAALQDAKAAQATISAAQIAQVGAAQALKG